ncbi:hypothetical protein PanWU01x14_356300 [Parasponia andersonii]|uniref:Uncharacterized protein n=1 Tax=Parasponia andersonii TaxID=3476 RepID=A0A2P5A914_PARAD|nr:hypothetical protein PanWU01x14_356300 [Parasponia andersonii]
MEGLIPFVYRVIVEYKNNGRQHDLLGSWFNESPSASYIRLPGDSGRFQTCNSDFPVFGSDFGFVSSPSNKPSAVPTAAHPSSSSSSQIMVSSGVHSPVRRKVTAN